jgi:hypothetical protein
LAHHDPNRSDEAIDLLVDQFKAQAGEIELFAAAEGKTVTFAHAASPPAAKGMPGADRHHPDVSAGKATMQPALGEQSALVTLGEPLLTERLARVLQNDSIPVSTCEPHRVTEAVQIERPSLLVIVGGQNASEALSHVKAIRRLVEPLGSLPIVLAGEAEGAKTNGSPGISDKLVAPFTDNYARTRLRGWLMRRACKWALPPVPLNEADRLAALHALNILDTPSNELFDSLVNLATDLFNVPIAAVTLVDRERQWFKASCGLSERETPRDESFCAHVVADPVTTIVPDTLLDERFAENPGVTGPPHLRFYAGHPIMLAKGHCLGTVCIADTRPRQLSSEQLQRLGQIASLAVNLIESGRV